MKPHKFYLQYRHNPNGFMYEHEFLVMFEEDEVNIVEMDHFQYSRWLRERKAFIDHHYNVFWRFGGSICSQNWEPYGTHVFSFPELSKAVRIKLMLPLDLPA